MCLQAVPRKDTISARDPWFDSTKGLRSVDQLERANKQFAQSGRASVQKTDMRRFKSCIATQTCTSPRTTRPTFWAAGKLGSLSTFDSSIAPRPRHTGQPAHAHKHSEFDSRAVHQGIQQIKSYMHPRKRFQVRVLAPRPARKSFNPGSGGMVDALVFGASKTLSGLFTRMPYLWFP
jgi:hypothetical protein